MIYPLSETKVLMGPVTFDQAVSLMQPDDTFELVFQQEVSKYGFTIFEPGKVYKGSKVLDDGRIHVEHEDIFVRGSTSTFTKEEFLKELKSQGEPCDLLDCNRSIFIRPGEHGGQKTFADALQNPSFARPVEDSGVSAALDPMSADDDPGEIIPPEQTPGSDLVGEPGVGIYIKPKTPNLKIERTQDGQYTISYGNISKKPIEGELQRLFGYANWEDYKRDNFEDLTKAKKRDGEGNIISAPTVQPFHVAYALEEFAQDFKIDDYELVAIPKGAAPTGGEDPNDRVLISIVSSLRKGFFGVDMGQDALAANGILNMAMYNPREGLVNKEIIDKIKTSANIGEKIQNLFDNAMFVKHPNGSYWRGDLQSPYVTKNRGEALVVKPSDASANMSIVNESLGGSPIVLVEQLLGGLVKGFKHLWRYRGDWKGRALRRGAKKSAAERAAKEAAEEAAEQSRRWRRMSAGEKFKHIGGKVLDKAGKPFEAAGKAIPGGGLLLPIAGWMGGEYVIEKYGERAWDWVVNTFGFDPSDPDMEDKVLEQLDNLSPEEAAEILSTLSDDVGQIDIASADDLEYYLLPAGWKGGGFLTSAEEVLAKRVGANHSSGFMVSPAGKSSVLDFKKAFKKISKSPAKNIPKTPKAPDRIGSRTKIAPTNILVFGHSQAGKFGKSLSSQAKEAGARITKIVRSGHSDGASKKGLDKKLDDIPNKKYSHAYLFLGGNTGAKGPDYQAAKKRIINHMATDLSIPRENLMVILPPVNLDNKYSKSRLSLNKRAEEYFQSLGVKVLPQVIGNKDDFAKDGYHIASTSSLARAASSDMLTSFSVFKSTTDPAPISFGGGPPRPVDKSKQDAAVVVVHEAKKAGVDPLFALTVARIESGLNPLSNISKKTRYKGLFQFGSQYKEEWQTKYGLEWDKVHDASHSAAAFMNVIKEKINTLRSRGVISRSTSSNVDPSEAYLVYLAWQQGTHGITLIVKAASSGTSVPDRIQKNMDNNTYPKTPNISPKGFLEMWSRKTKGYMNTVRRKYAAALGSSPSQGDSQSAQASSSFSFLDFLNEETKNIKKEQSYELAN